MIGFATRSVRNRKVNREGSLAFTGLRTRQHNRTEPLVEIGQQDCVAYGPYGLFEAGNPAIVSLAMFAAFVLARDKSPILAIGLPGSNGELNAFPIQRKSSNDVRSQIPARFFRFPTMEL